MKKYLLSLLMLGGTIICLAQTPLGINYQAILRNSEGTIRANETIALQIGIIDDQGNSFYSEIHNTITNDFGLANVVVGQGSSSDNLSDIDWSAGPYFLEITVNGTTMGTNQLLSVPYALFSQKSQEVEYGDNWGSQEIISNKSLDGNGTASDPLEIAQQGAVTGQVLKWNGSEWGPEDLGVESSLWQKNGYNIFYNTGSVGIETENPQADLHINGTDGMLVQGEYGSGKIQNLGEGVRLHFYPRKAAFMVGTAYQDRWDDAQIGDKSIAIGNGAGASGSHSVAIGNYANAPGHQSVAMGTAASAEGENSIALGQSTTASGGASTSMGLFTIASGQSSTALGSSTRASGGTSIAMGSGTRASGLFSTTMGHTIEAAGDYTVAIGLNSNQSTVTQNNTMAIMGGKVGIGTVDPGVALHVHDRIRIRKDPTYGSLYGELIHEGGGSGFRINANANGGWADLHLQTDGTTRLFIESAGNVGIGTTSPSKRLYVNGSAGGTQAWNASDMRFKKNIQTIQSSLDGIMHLRGVRYEWREGSEDESTGFDNKTHYGVIAQEVEEIFPYLVDQPGETDEMKHVEYNGLIGILVEAIKELKEQNDDLRKRIEVLEH